LSAVEASRDALGFTGEQRVHVDTIHTTAGHDMKKVAALLTRIARTNLHIETLETRCSDRLDFHNVAVWSLREALEAAYNAGIEHGCKAAGTSKSAD
jgi:hypothetical protein